MRGGTVTVTGEEDSLDLLRLRQRFDVVISDICMPGTDGYGFMRDLCARGADVPAIALTALRPFARSEDAERALRAGFGLHIAKPVDAKELVSALGRMIRPESRVDSGSTGA